MTYACLKNEQEKSLGVNLRNQRAFETERDREREKRERETKKKKKKREGRKERTEGGKEGRKERKKSDHVILLLKMISCLLVALKAKTNSISYCRQHHISKFTSGLSSLLSEL
jgi:DNA invertase Pin-like site-specific DNA recombinase